MLISFIYGYIICYIITFLIYYTVKNTVKNTVEFTGFYWQKSYKQNPVKIMLIAVKLISV